MKQNKKLLVWIVVFGPVVAILLMLWLVPEFMEKNWLVPFSLTMIPFILSLNYQGDIREYLQL
jgi:apolipoprotein N-acyltransferase